MGKGMTYLFIYFFYYRDRRQVLLPRHHHFMHLLHPKSLHMLRCHRHTRQPTLLLVLHRMHHFNLPILLTHPALEHIKHPCTPHIHLGILPHRTRCLPRVILPVPTHHLHKPHPSILQVNLCRIRCFRSSIIWNHNGTKT